MSLLFGGIGFFGWFYGIPEYVLTYAFLAISLAHCAFMRYWREIFRFFGIRHNQLVAAPARAGKSLGKAA